jgi:FkbM family methyltransferase
LNIRRIYNLLKIIFFPIVFAIRAIRAYRHMNNWKKYVVGGQVNVCLEIPQGVFTIDMRSVLAWTMFEGTYEKETMSLLPILRLQEGLIVNIGANIGFYAVQLARIFPKNPILAVEPNPEAYALLKRNIAQNNLVERIRTLNACISAKKGKVSFFSIPGKPEYSSINGIIPLYSSNNKMEIIEIETFRLSDIIEREKVALIVMDVEGAEQLVLDGGKDIIIRDRPLILCECADVLLEKFQSSSSQLISFLKDIDYEVRDSKRPQKPLIAPFEGNILAFYLS